MKTKIITIALIAVTGFANQIFAQETAALKTRTKSNQTNEKSAGNITSIDDWQSHSAKRNGSSQVKNSETLSCKVTPSDDGFIITMGSGVKSPRDAASGLPTGKRMNKTMVLHINSSDNSVTEVKSPRDAASGLATGRRIHKPMQITNEIDKSSPTMGKSSAENPSAEIALDESGLQRGGGAGKATFKEFTVTKRCNGKTTTISCYDGECEISLDDCSNGTCDLVCSWSWGANQQGSSMSSSGSVGFSVEVQDGACIAMTINEKR